jgi:hypothetical protein
VLFAADPQWWAVYGDEALDTFAGELWAAADIGGARGAQWGPVSARVRAKLKFVEVVVDGVGLCTKPGRVHFGKNSGYMALGLAYHWGCARDILLGYDMQRGPKGESHFHGDHEGGLPNLGTMHEWARLMNELAQDLRAHGVRVINATRRTALTCFEQLPLEKALDPGKAPLVLHGMSGMGDNLHQRAVVRELMRRHEVWLKTPWPQIYHDMPQLHLVPITSTLRTQAKNEARSAELYRGGRAPAGTPELRPSYSPEKVKAAGSVLGAMSEVCGVRVGDFRMPVPQAWRKKADQLFRTKRPILVYRPLVARKEWGGATTRNPDPASYVELLRAIRKRFFVVSVADLVPGVEWTVGPQLEADVEYHAGELEFEVLTGLFARAALAFSAPGFAVLLAQAVGTPAITVFGGYEDARSFSAGARFTSWLAVEPITPCPCWSHTHACDKRIDVHSAVARAQSFIRENVCGSA